MNESFQISLRKYLTNISFLIVFPHVRFLHAHTNTHTLTHTHALTIHTHTTTLSFSSLSIIFYLLIRNSHKDLIKIVSPKIWPLSRSQFPLPLFLSFSLSLSLLLSLTIRLVHNSSIKLALNVRVLTIKIKERFFGTRIYFPILSS